MSVSAAATETATVLAARFLLTLYHHRLGWYSRAATVAERGTRVASTMVVVATGTVVTRTHRIAATRLWLRPHQQWQFQLAATCNVDW